MRGSEYDYTVIAIFIIVFGGALVIGVTLALTPYGFYEVEITEKKLISEEFLTIKVHDAKFLSEENKTKIRYVSGSGFFGETEYKSLFTVTNHTIYPDDKLLIKQEKYSPSCDYYEIIDGERKYVYTIDNNKDSKVSRNGTMNFYHSFKLKSDWSGDKCFYKMTENTIMEERK